MSNLNALHWRYATKKFDSSRILEEEKISVLKQAFNLTATSYGLQPLKLIVISNKKLQEKLKDASYGQKQLDTASHVLVICTEQKIDEKFIKNYFDLVKSIRKTPEKILEPFQNFLLDDFKAKAIEEIENWAVNQAYLALGNLMTICASEKIDSCPMEGFEADKYETILDLESKNLKATLVLPVGYRAEDDMFSEFKKVRRPLEEVVIEMN